MQHDPHHLYPSENGIYIFLISAAILVPLLVYAGAKLMLYLDRRERRKPNCRDESKVTSEKEN